MPLGQVRFVYRHYVFLGQESSWAAEATECAGEQGRFWPYYDRLNAIEAAGRNSGAFAPDALKRIASEVGLNADGFSGCLDSGRYSGRVRAETAAGGAKGVSSTPTVFVNGRKLPGVPTWDELVRALLEAQRG